jgi:hypothetical protein
MKRFHSFCRVFPGLDVSWTAHHESLRRYFQALGRGEELDDDEAAAAKNSDWQSLRSKCPNSLRLAYQIYGDREE